MKGAIACRMKMDGFHFGLGGCCLVWLLSCGLPLVVGAAEPLACMSVSELKAVTVRHAKLQASEKNLQEQVKAYLQLDEIRKEKSAIQEQHVAAQEEIIDAQASVLNREQRVSRYKSEFVGLAAAVAAIIWVVN